MRKFMRTIGGDLINIDKIVSIEKKAGGQQDEDKWVVHMESGGDRRIYEASLEELSLELIPNYNAQLECWCVPVTSEAQYQIEIHPLIGWKNSSPDDVWQPIPACRVDNLRIYVHDREKLIWTHYGDACLQFNSQDDLDTDILTWRARLRRQNAAE